MRVNLEQKHIDNGVVGHALYCPIALCLWENLKEINRDMQITDEDENDEVFVYRNQIWIGDHKFTPSSKLYHWIESFDHNPKEAQPLILDIDDSRIACINSE